ncbi:transposase [Stenotrophomonas maltophilia]
MNEHWFFFVGRSKEKVEAWRRFYNEECPHSALAWKTLSGIQLRTAILSEFPGTQRG